jgi:hypothetical protein
MNFNFQLLACFIFGFSQKKMASLIVVHPFKMYQYTKFHGPMLTWESSAPTPKVEIRHLEIVKGMN